MTKTLTNLGFLAAFAGVTMTVASQGSGWARR